MFYSQFTQVSQRTSVRWNWKLRGSGSQFSSQISSVFGQTCAHLSSRARNSSVSSPVRDHTKVHNKLLYTALKQKATILHLGFKCSNVKYISSLKAEPAAQHSPSSKLALFCLSRTRKSSAGLTLPTWNAPTVNKPAGGSLHGRAPGETRQFNVASVLLQNKTKDKVKALSMHFHFQGSVKR